MSKFDRYMLSQLLLYFGFFALVLVAVFWINRAVRLFDRLIGDGQSALVFLEFTALGMPRLILLVLPLASFAAAVFVTNRLKNESELTVMQATGSGPVRLARPVLVFGLVLAAATALLVHVLVPVSMDQLKQREFQVSQDVTARLLTEGTFLHPGAGVTLYTRDIGEDGVLRDVFLSDRRDPELRVTYTAANAYLVRQDGQTNLIMVDGIAQRLDTVNNRLSTATYQDFSYDISSLVSVSNEASRDLRAISTYEFLTDPGAVVDQTGANAGAIAEELHSRFAAQFFVAVAALVGFSVLVSRQFSRFGAWREIFAGFVILLLLDALRAVFSDSIRDAANMWLLAYVPSGLGIGLTAAFLYMASQPGLFARRRVTP